VQNKNEAGNQNDTKQGTNRAVTAGKKTSRMLRELSGASLVHKYYLCMGNTKGFVVNRACRTREVTTENIDFICTRMFLNHFFLPILRKCHR